MSKVITARVDDDTFALVDKVASLHDRSRAWIVARALDDFLREEKMFFESLEAAEASIDRGEYYTQEEMEVWLEAKIAARSKPV
jgi:predicted transcriptional regulator